MSTKTKPQLLAELAELRQRVAELEMAFQEKETRTSLLSKQPLLESTNAIRRVGSRS